VSSKAIRIDDREASRAVREVARREKLEEGAAAKRLILHGKRKLDEERAIEQFKAGRVSSGRVAEILSIPLHEALELLARHGLTVSDETVGEFREGLRHLREKRSA
jgi:predicted HTH domain antitoxin